MNVKCVEFDDIIKETGDLDKILLLGNGFSISIDQRFHYKSLLDFSKNERAAENKLPERIISIFENYKTCDFEKIIAALNSAHKIVNVYNDYSVLVNEIKNDLEKLKTSFRRAITEQHPKNYSDIKNFRPENVCNFLSNFKYIYTTNYDLLLYWIQMTAEKNLTIPKNDGFLKDPETGKLTWYGHADQDTYYLHGALHIFHAQNTYKFKKNTYNLISEIESLINQGVQPEIVLEGSSDEKIKTINSKPYLWHCYESLKKITGALFILGSSLNKYGDAHIIDAIKASQIKFLCIGLYDVNDSAQVISNGYEIANKLKISVSFFNSAALTSW